ncbi:MAG: hypothetical protein ACOX9B_04860 [Candidatus Xenobium sp.]|jgi:hypothetical protein|nr:hypothetical protein [Burkholderiales bacterium]
MNIPKKGPVIRLTFRVAIIAVTLLLTFCIAAQAAVVEGGDVEREVDTPAGVQIQKNLGEDSSEPETFPTSTGATTHAPPQPTSTSLQQEPETPTETGVQVPPPEKPTTRGGVLGYVVVGLIVVALGTFIVLMVARSRGRN